MLCAHIIPSEQVLHRQCVTFALLPFRAFLHSGRAHEMLSNYSELWEYVS